MDYKAYNHVQNPEEKPKERICSVSGNIARRIPADRLTAVPSADEEPNADVRYWIARRISEELLPAAIPTPSDEPDEDVRYCIANRIPTERLPYTVPSREEEPSVSVRETIARRIERERIAGNKENSCVCSCKVSLTETPGVFLLFANSSCPYHSANKNTRLMRITQPHK